ncbi:hypothetical protein [Bacillus toyonensis]|uniref:hypothetical protein n=1 Tax=Bacillus toyonensis TaxID=155322 RepID=UPI000BF40B67|nr:hypothetical protein [Bacillus toyonensis]PGB58375.1 hypothetical protein COM00_23120 [Bacillus toyonensis]
MTVQKEKVTRRVVCRKCKSDQIVGNKRGYNFKRMFLILFLMLATLIIIGLAAFSFHDIIPLSSPLSGIAAFIVGFIMFLGAPITLFSGFIGRKNIVNGCMNCGHTWMPKK